MQALVTDDTDDSDTSSQSSQSRGRATRQAIGKARHARRLKGKGKGKGKGKRKVVRHHKRRAPSPSVSTSSSEPERPAAKLPRTQSSGTARRNQRGTRHGYGGRGANGGVNTGAGPGAGAGAAPTAGRGWLTRFAAGGSRVLDTGGHDGPESPSSADTSNGDTSDEPDEPDSDVPEAGAARPTLSLAQLCQAVRGRVLGDVPEFDTHVLDLNLRHYGSRADDSTKTSKQYTFDGFDFVVPSSKLGDVAAMVGVGMDCHFNKKPKFTKHRTGIIYVLSIDKPFKAEVLLQGRNAAVDLGPVADAVVEQWASASATVLDTKGMAYTVRVDRAAAEGTGCRGAIIEARRTAGSAKARDMLRQASVALQHCVTAGVIEPNDVTVRLRGYGQDYRLCVDEPEALAYDPLYRFITTLGGHRWVKGTVDFCTDVRYRGGSVVLHNDSLFWRTTFRHCRVALYNFLGLLDVVSVHGPTRSGQRHLPGLAKVARSWKLYSTTSYARPNREPLEQVFMTRMAVCKRTKLTEHVAAYVAAQRAVCEGMRRLSLRLELAVSVKDFAAAVSAQVDSGRSHGDAVIQLSHQVFEYLKPAMRVFPDTSLRTWYRDAFLVRLQKTMASVLEDSTNKGEVWQRAALRSVLVVATVMSDGGVNRKAWARSVDVIKSYARHAGAIPKCGDMGGVCKILT